MTPTGKLIVILVLGFLVLSPCLAQTDSMQIESAQTDSITPAPTFFLKTLDGEPFFLSRHVGDRARDRMKSPVVLSFFATWCIPCRAEIPVLHDIQEEFPGTRIMLVNVNEETDSVATYVDKMNIELPVLMDLYGVVVKKYGVINSKNLARLPSLAIISESGELVYFHQGYKKGDEEKVRAVLSDLSGN